MKTFLDQLVQVENLKEFVDQEKPKTEIKTMPWSKTERKTIPMDLFT